jgi:hypothetical protein
LKEVEMDNVVRDPDHGLKLRKSLRDRLELQTAAVARGERGESFADVVRRLRIIDEDAP